MGGVATIIMYLTFAWWMALEYLEVYAGEGKFTISQTVSLTQLPDGSFPEYSISSDKMFLSYNFTDESYDKAIERDIDQYFTALWV